MRVGVRSGVPGTWAPTVHANCPNNECAALAMRTLAPLPKPPDSPLGGGVLQMFRRLRGLARTYGGLRWSYLETAESYDGMLRRRYIEAERSLREDGPLRSSDAFLRAFLKAEKLGAGKDAKPRMIFPRSPRYNLVLASWLKPFEHWLWGRLTARRLFGGSSTRVVGKGLSPRQRASLIVRKFGQFERCVVFEVDGKAFEAHVTQPQLAEEHSVYLAAYHWCPELRSVLSRQEWLSGVTAGGVRFRRPGGRASGDYNTGMGNTLIMLAVVSSVLKGRCKFDLLVDGDNALVFLPEGDLDGVRATFAADVLRVSGHEMTLEKPVSYLEAVRFGRSAPVFLGPRLGWTMVREPEAVLSGSTASHRWLNEPVFGRRWLNGVARCELSLARGLPVLQAWAVGILRATEVRRQAPAWVYRDFFVMGAWLAGEESVLPVARECRLSFERAFGWSPDEQVAAEASFGSIRCELESMDLVEGLPPSRWWEAEPGVYDTYRDARVFLDW